MGMPEFGLPESNSRLEWQAGEMLFESASSPVRNILSGSQHWLGPTKCDLIRRPMAKLLYSELANHRKTQESGRITWKRHYCPCKTQGTVDSDGGWNWFQTSCDWPEFVRSANTTRLNGSSIRIGPTVTIRPRRWRHFRYERRMGAS
jgi:hypothetical protein